MPQNQVDSGACGRHVTPADGVGSLKQGPRTHPAHADGRLGDNGADRDGQNGNPGLTSRRGRAKISSFRTRCRHDIRVNLPYSEL